MFRKTFPVGMLQCNCTILGDLTTGQAIVVDPGDECDRIVEELARAHLKLQAIVHTHAHIDHIGATKMLAERTGATTYLHPEDLFLQKNLRQQAMFLGIPTPEQGTIDHDLQDAQAISFGAFELGVLHTPGHTPGSVCFVVPGQDICFSGDTLFSGGIGRTDLWGGDYDTIERSIRHKLYSLNGALEVVPGHGPNTTIDIERRTNPFIRLHG